MDSKSLATSFVSHVDAIQSDPEAVEALVLAEARSDVRRRIRALLQSEGVTFRPARKANGAERTADAQADAE